MGALTVAISLLGGVLGVTGVVAAGVVVARSKITGATIEMLNQNLTAQEQRIVLLTVENTTLSTRVVALEATNDELFREVKSMPAFAEMSGALVEMTKVVDRQTGLLEHWLDDLTRESWRPGDPDRRADS